MAEAEKRVIFTVGYNARGWTHQALWELIYQSGVKIIDCRFQPKSQRPEWRKGRLMQIFGVNYAHVPDLGNLNYKGGPIKLARPETGINYVRWVLKHSSAVILLCACPRHESCHRTVVAELCQREIKEYNIRIEHLEPPKPQGEADHG